VVLAVTSTFLTIPSFALFGLLVPLLGLGWPPTVFALVMYALLPIVRNTVVGLRSVDPAIAESAQGMGMSRRERLLRIEMPLAWPVILTGMRVSTLIIVGITAVAAFVNGPGLGSDIFSGISRIGSAVALNQVLGAVLGIVVLAILYDGLFAVLGRLTTSRGLE
jgi:osmoprotectant transport system permease protein